MPRDPEKNRENARRYYERHREEVLARLRLARALHPERQKAADKRYYESHKEEVQAKNRARWALNAERYRAMSRAWRERNPERKAAADRRRVERNREAYYAYQRAYAKAHPEMSRARVIRRRALLLGAAGNFTTKEWLAKIAEFDGRCVYCGSQEKMTVDHIRPLSRGGSNWIGNIVPACSSCNKAKGAMSAAEFRRKRRGNQSPSA